MRWGFYLTTAPNPKGTPGLLAVCSDGTPQRGHEPVTVLDIEEVPDQAAAQEWFNRVIVDQPWQTRS